MKIYERTKPKRMIPDMLKKHLLEGSPLSLIKGLTNVEDLWKRLKCACGDPKLLLKNKISLFRSVNQLCHLRDQEKLVC